MTDEERQLLAPYDRDGGMNIRSNNIRNPIFLYDQTQLGEEYVWDEMANYLNIPNIPHDQYIGSHGINAKNETYKVDLNLCVEEYDDFRALMMIYSYELAVWLQEYFIPLARDAGRTDVVIPRPDLFYNLTEGYKVDPCGRLVRTDDGDYELESHDDDDIY